MYIQIKYIQKDATTSNTWKELLILRELLWDKKDHKILRLLWNGCISQDTKNCLCGSIIQDITLYGYEIQLLTLRLRQKIKTVQFDCFRKCLRVTTEDKRRKIEIWNRMGIICYSTKMLENRVLKWYVCVKQMLYYKWSERISDWFPKGRRKQRRLALTEEYNQAMAHQGPQEEGQLDPPLRIAGMGNS